MAVSVFDMFKVGIGPSSSHTVGPMRAGHAFVKVLRDHGMLEQATSLKIELMGSLAATGKGHGTDTAAQLGLLGRIPETMDPDEVSVLIGDIRASRQLKLDGMHAVAFDPEADIAFHADKVPAFHTNAMEFSVFAGDSLLYRRRYYSVGGGFIVAAREDDPEQPVTPKAFQGVKTKPYPYRTGDELMKIARDNNLTIAELVYRNECVDRMPEEVDRRLDEIWQVMHAAVERGMRQTEVLPGPFRIARRANALMQDVMQRTDDPLAVLDWVNVYAMAVAEDRAGFAIEVLAARGQTAGATLALSDMHKTAGQQLVALANGNFDDSGAQSSSSGQSDPRQKVYAIDQLLANPTTIADTASGQTVPTAAAIEMDCARAQIKAVTESKSSTESDMLLILAALAAKHAYTAFQLGYPATDAELFE